MLTLLQPLALFGLSLLAIPVVIHLFAPRKTQTTPFSSLRWLRASQHRKSKRIRWHQLLLFLLRAGLIALLFFALTRPMWMGKDSASLIERIVIVDAGRTMGYNAGGEPTPLDRGKAIAETLLTRTATGQRATLIVAGDGSARLLRPLREDPTDNAAAVKALQPSAISTSLADALPAVQAALAAARPGATVELAIVTDMHPTFWSPAAFEAWLDNQSRDVRVRVYDVAPAQPTNAWIAGATVQTDEATGNRVIVADLMSHGPQPVERAVVLGEHRKTTTLTPGRMQRVELPVPGDTSIAEIRLEPADALADDDVYRLPLMVQPAARRVLLIDSGAIGRGTAPARLYVQAAVDALKHVATGAIDLTMRRETEVRASDIADADVILLLDVKAIDAALSKRLADRLAHGARLVTFTGPAMEPATYDATGLLPAMIGSVRQRRPGAPVVIRRGDHPLIQGLFESHHSNLAQTNIRQWRELTPRDGAQVLATVDDDAPLIVTTRIGAGTSVLINTTANDDWSDLSRRSGFVPLLHRLIVGPALPGDLHALGVPMHVRLPDAPREGSIVLTDPNGDTLSVRLTSGDTAVTAPPTVPGVYHLTYETDGGATTRLPLIVEPDRIGSNVAATSEAQLAELWPNVDVTVHRSAPDMQVTHDDRLALSPWLIWLALSMLIAEFYIVHRVCPQSGPKQATLTVARDTATPPRARAARRETREEETTTL